MPAGTKRFTIPPLRRWDASSPDRVVNVRWGRGRSAGGTWLVPMVLVGFAVVVGCGTSRLTHTARSASEEMLLSHSIDRSVGRLGLQVLAGQRVFLDTSNLGDVTYNGYLTGALRQHLLASGVRLVNEADLADVVVEARAGAVATAQHETLIGIPQTTVPAMLLGAPATLPEIAIVKKIIHIGVAKVGVFAYRVDTGGGVWQSGIEENQSVSESNWYLGVGPFQSGDVVVDGGQMRPLGPSRTTDRGVLECPLWIGELPLPRDPNEPLSEPIPEGGPGGGDPRDPGGPDPSQPDPGQPDPGQPESGQPESGDSESGEPESKRPDPDSPETLPSPNERWQWVSPVVISNEEAGSE